MKAGILSAFFALCVAAACGKTEELAHPAPEIKLCDPKDNPGACPASLRDRSEFSRDLLLGEEGIGIEVQKYNDNKMMEQCRQSKAVLLGEYQEPNSQVKGLKAGEFINSMQFQMVSTGSICVEKNLFNSCTKKISTARIVCKYEVYFTPDLVPSKS